MNPFVSIFRSLVRQIEQNRRVAICTVVGSHGSTPQAPGASMLLHENMTTEGTLGGGCVEAEVRKQAFELLRRNKSALLTFRLDHDYGWDDGLICGGTMRVTVMPINADDDVHRRDASATEESRQFLRAADDLEANRPADVTLRVESDGRLQDYRLHIEAPARLVIAGAGHVGAELARMAANLDFDVAIFDDRGDMMGPQRLPPPIRPVVGDIEKTLRAWSIDAHTYVVIVTRGHNHDEQALHAVIDSPARYIGMIGSRRKVKLMFDDLAALGVDPAKLAKVHAPIGLAIGAVTVPEIAVSILAQLIEVRRTEKPTHVEGPFDVYQSRDRLPFTSQSDVKGEGSGPAEADDVKPTLHVSESRRAVYAMVLAAGQGRRMGRLKQLLPYKQGTILDSVLEAVLESSVDGVVVVTNPFLAGHLRGRLPEEHCLLVENTDPASEMLASVQLGLAGALQEFELAVDDGIMVLLADQPQITAGVITTCAESFRLPAHPPGIMMATYKGKRGHPAIFRVDLLRGISSWGPNRRLNELAREHSAEVRELPITIAPMPLDVNTPQDYDRLMGSS